MEVVEISESCFRFVLSLSSHVYTNCCIYDNNGNVIAFKRSVDNSFKYYGLIINE